MTAQITGVWANACNWPRGRDTFLGLYADADRRARLRDAHERHGKEMHYRGPQGEPTITTCDFTSPGRLWERP